MERKKRLAIRISTVVVLILLLVSVIAPSIAQNRQIRSYLNSLMTAVRQKNNFRIAEFYLLPAASEDQSFDYQLLGWKINDIDSQPYPMETVGNADVTANIEMYYKLPPAMLQPKGRYTVGTYPPYGKCTRTRWRYIFVM